MCPQMAQLRLQLAAIKRPRFKYTKTLAVLSCAVFERNGNDVAPLNNINVCIMVGDVRVKSNYKIHRSSSHKFTNNRRRADKEGKRSL